MIGSHIKKEKTFIKTFTQCYDTQYNYNNNFTWESFPVQIFTGSTKSWNRPPVDKQDIQNTLKYIQKNNVKLFIHSIYLINLSRPQEEIIKGTECLKYDLILGSKIGARGVVVHVGKSLKMGTDTGITNMYNNIINILPFIDESCPLLLETPAGQGTEVLTNMNDFINFYGRFTKEQQCKIRICLDTCHVFSAGFYPIDYLKNLFDKYPQSLVLVHYNDSKGELGCCKDRHETPGEGCIGVEKMCEVSEWCNKYNIPMVMEL